MEIYLLFCRFSIKMSLYIKITYWYLFCSFLTYKNSV
nr:MAG TPA: hypothetical protein [Caudoviricetes sp.]